MDSDSLAKNDEIQPRSRGLVLRLGTLKEIDNPSLDQIRHHVRFMPAESPYIVLYRDNLLMHSRFHYLRRSLYGSYPADKYRIVFVKDDRKEYVTYRDYEGAVEVFEKFTELGSDVLRCGKWRRQIVDMERTLPGLLSLGAMLALFAFVIYLGLHIYGII